MLYGKLWYKSKPVAFITNNYSIKDVGYDWIKVEPTLDGICDFLGYSFEELPKNVQDAITCLELSWKHKATKPIKGIDKGRNTILHPDFEQSVLEYRDVVIEYQPGILPWHLEKFVE